MDGNVMADPDSELNDALGLRNISGSLFNVPGFLAGFSAKGPLDSDMVQSPTSPLDLRVFANSSNPFSVRSPRSSSLSGYQKKWDSNKIGLGIVNLLADEIRSDGEDFDSPKRKTILFGPQVKKTTFPHSLRYSNEYLDNSMKSNSLPRNYIITQLFQAKNPNRSGDSSLVFGNEKVPREPQPDTSRLSPSLFASTQNSDLSSRSFCSENGTSNINSSSLPNGRASQVDNSLVSKPSSLPIPIGHSIGHLSAPEIELSEDYTCIISHGPNPKTTHIFGDYVLECHNNELTNFDKKVKPGSKVPQLDNSTETAVPYLSDEFLSSCYYCKKKLEKEDDIYMYRGDKAFCSFDCRSDEIFAEEIEKTCNNSSNSSPDQCDDEDLFLLGAPMNM